MDIVYFLLFAFVSWIILMQIFKFTTYHKHFKMWVIVLIGFAIMDGYLLFRFRLHEFFIYHVLLFLVFLFSSYRKQSHTGRTNKLAMVELTGMSEEAYLLSIERTMKYYIISSVIYLLLFSISFLYFYNN